MPVQYIPCMPEASHVSWQPDTAGMQVQLPQFRKAGLEVTAVFSRGQQRARQVAEQARTPQHVAMFFPFVGTRNDPTNDLGYSFCEICTNAEWHQTLLLQRRGLVLVRGRYGLTNCRV